MVRQGDIIYLELNPTKEHEQQGFRPCLCVSNNLVYDYSNLIIIAPISNTKREYPLYYSLENYNISGKVLIDQLRSVDPSKRRIKFVEKIKQSDLENILDIAKLIFEIK